MATSVDELIEEIRGRNSVFKIEFRGWAAA